MKALKAASREAARDAVDIIKSNVPVSSGELRDSVHQRGFYVSVDAPHAMAVENGSAPHVVPIEALIAWVKKKGTQAQSSTGLRRMGTAIYVASQLKSRQTASGANSIDDPERIARAIQHSIALYGTKPTFFLRSSQPEIVRAINRRVLDFVRSL